MAGGNYTKFKGVSQWGYAQFTDQLSANISSYLNNGFLEIGSFANTYVGGSGAYGGETARLRAVSDPNFSSGQVFEGFRSNWVYESGLDYSYQPIAISGVYVNGTFYPRTTTGTYSHYIDYPQGRVVFPNGIPTNSTVKCEYSYKLVNVTTSDSVIARTIQSNSLRLDRPQFLLLASGDWNTLAQQRVQLPVVVIEPAINSRLEGLQLGGGHFRIQNILMSVVSETPWERNKIADILANQADKTIYWFDLNLVGTSGVWRLGYDGNINPSGYQYPDLVDEFKGYRNRNCWIMDSRLSESYNQNNLYFATVAWTLKVQVDEI